MRQLKYHEQKLLRKVSLYSWEDEETIRVAKNHAKISDSKSR
jgi:U3 small nucleolar ribonucleoprotein protein IMP3